MTRPLSARSVIASTLLGTHPPRLRGALLVALAEEFGIAEGTARAAMSRMVDKGELRNDDGTYELTGLLVDRQRRQDRARRRTAAPWSGTWEQAIVRPGARSPARRAQHRILLTQRKLAEVRDGVWMRPSNLERPVDDEAVGDGIWWTTVTMDPDDQRILVAELWDLDAWADRADELIAAMDDERLSLAEGFELSASVLRHYLADPELPATLAPPGWPASELRARYDAFDRDYRARLRSFFASVRAATP